MNVSITKELESQVERLVKSGLYSSSSEVIRAGLRMLLEKEQKRAREEAALFENARVGLAQLERGESVTIPFGSLTEYVRDLAEAQGMVPKREK